MGIHIGTEYKSQLLIADFFTSTPMRHAQYKIKAKQPLNCYVDDYETWHVHFYWRTAPWATSLWLSVHVTKYLGHMATHKEVKSRDLWNYDINTNGRESCEIIYNFYNDVLTSAMASQITSLTIFFTQSLILAQIKENIKAPRHWPLCGELTGDRYRWIPRTKSQ